MVNEVDESILFTDFVSRISKGTIYTRFIRPDDLLQFILGQVTEPWREIFLNSPWIDIKEIQHLHEKRSKHRLPVSQPTFHHPLSSNSDLAKEEIDSVREKESSRRLLIDFSFQQSLRPLYSIYRSSIVASRKLGRAKIWKNLNLMKSIHFNFPIFSKLSSIKSSIKSDRLFEKPVISRYKGLARKGSPVYFQFTAFLFHGEEGNTSLFVSASPSNSQNFIFPERGGGGGGKLSFDRNDVTRTTPPLFRFLFHFLRVLKIFFQTLLPREERHRIEEK